MVIGASRLVGLLAVLGVDANPVKIPIQQLTVPVNPNSGSPRLSPNTDVVLSTPGSFQTTATAGGRDETALRNYLSTIGGSEETKFMAGVNKVRCDNNRATVHCIDPQLVEAARMIAECLASGGSDNGRTLDHNCHHQNLKDRIQAVHVVATGQVAENLHASNKGAGRPVVDTVEAIVGWYKSDGHFKNMVMDLPKGGGAMGYAHVEGPDRSVEQKFRGQRVMFYAMVIGDIQSKQGCVPIADPGDPCGTTTAGTTPSKTRQNLATEAPSNQSAQGMMSVSPEKIQKVTNPEVATQGLTKPSGGTRIIKKPVNTAAPSMQTALPGLTTDGEPSIKKVRKLRPDEQPPLNGKVYKIPVVTASQDPMRIGVDTLSSGSSPPQTAPVESLDNFFQ